MSNWTDFFKVKGEYAIRNLTVFITIVVASLVICYLAIRVNDKGETRLQAEMFIAYLLAGGGVYQFGKWQDSKTERTEMLTAPDAPPVTTTINQPTNVNVAGDVTPKKKVTRK